MDSPTLQKELVRCQRFRAKQSKKKNNCHGKTDRGHGWSPTWFFWSSISKAINKKNQSYYNKQEALLEFVDYSVTNKVYKIKAPKARYANTMSW